MISYNKLTDLLTNQIIPFIEKFPQNSELNNIILEVGKNDKSYFNYNLQPDEYYSIKNNIDQLLNNNSKIKISKTSSTNYFYNNLEFICENEKEMCVQHSDILVNNFKSPNTNHDLRIKTVVNKTVEILRFPGLDKYNNIEYRSILTYHYPIQKTKSIDINFIIYSNKNLDTATKFDKKYAMNISLFFCNDNINNIVNNIMDILKIIT